MEEIIKNGSVVNRKDIKKICESVLRKFCAYCKRNNLSFNLGYGTALGAVRHKGFIPWDDDIDVIMPRPDYNKLLTIFDDEAEDLSLLCHERDGSYYYPFAKLCDRNTVLVEEHFYNGKNMGIYIDIFPLEGNGNDRTIAQKHLIKCIKTQQKLNNAMAKHFFWSNSNMFVELARYIRYRIIKSIGPEFYYNKLCLLMKKYNFKDSQYVSNNSWCTYAVKDLFEKRIFESSIEIEFEGNLYPVPEEYDFYLSSLYGDYMKLPSKEKRVSHHDMIAYYRDV